jgi:hypothetical protein|tara:strand:+ start:393 stop:950 length:558 start_codon:yes stop_codon:yes gene_type:complete
MAITRLNNNSLTSITALPTAITTGKILQIQSTLLQTHFTVSVTANTNTEVTNLNLNITPSSSSSKILLFGRLFCEASTTDAQNSGVFFLRDSTKINAHNVSDAGSRNNMLQSLPSNYTSQDANSTPETFGFFTLDSPSSSSQINYKIGYLNAQNCTLNVNRTTHSTNSAAYEAGSSEIIAMEIAG